MPKNPLQFKARDFYYVALTAMNNKIKIALVGIGDVYERFYSKAFDKICLSYPDQFEIYCVDNSVLWKGEAKARREKTRREIENKTNFQFIDVNAGNFADWVRNRKFDFVIIATPDYDHVDSIIKWLEADCDRFLVEKPFSDKASKITELFNHPKFKRLDEDTEIERVRAFSHYRSKVHSQLGDETFREQLDDELGSPLTTFRFFCLEDFSGTDEAHLQQEQKDGFLIKPERNGPIEIPVREGSLQKGMIFDLGSHMFPILEYFGKPSTFDIQKIWVAKYAGVDFDDTIPAQIERETFARLDFTFEGSGGQTVFGQAYLGKGIRGIENPDKFELDLKQPEEGEVKFFEIGIGLGKKVQIFFKRTRKSDEVNLMRIITPGKEPQEKEFAIKNAYVYLLEQAIFPKTNHLFLSTKTAKTYLDKIEEIKGKIDERKKGRAYPTYLLGKLDDKGKVIRYPEYLDEIMAKLEPEPFWEKS